MVKIALDAGHGINTPGKRTPDGEREWSFNDKVLRAAEAELKRYSGVQILRTDDASGKTDVPLGTRTSKANAWGADVFVSFHHNASTGRWHGGGGTEVYWFNHPQANRKSGELAAILAPKVAQAMDLRNRGVMRANFQVLRETKMPAVLVEGGFMDSTVDIVPMRDDARLRAQGVAIAEGIAQYFELKDAGKPAATKPPVQASKPAASNAWDERYGNTGPRVTQLQKDLVALGYKVAVDGSFGPALRDAVVKFQRDHKLGADGIYGPASQVAMRKALDAKKAPAKTLYRVIIDGKQKGAYGENDNAVAEARKAIAAGAKNIRIEKV